VDFRGCGFDQADETLVPLAMEGEERVFGGACGHAADFTGKIEYTCPFAAKLGTGKGERAVCTHLDCFRAKKRAADQRWMASVTAPGVEPLGPENLDLVFLEDGVTLRGEYGHVELGEPPEEWEIRKGMEAAVDTWARLTKGRDVPEKWIRDGKGNVRKLVARDLAIAASLANKHDIFRRGKAVESAAAAQPQEDRGAVPAVERAVSSAAREKSEVAEDGKRKQAEEEAEAVWQGKIKALVDRIESLEELPSRFWGVVWWFLSGYFPDGLSVMARRRGMEPEVFDEHAEKLMRGKGAAAFVELVLQETKWSEGELAEQGLTHFAAACDVDLKAATKLALSEVKAGRKKEKEPAAAQSVRELIAELARKRGMTLAEIDQLAGRVIGKSYESAVGSELKAVAEAIKELPLVEKGGAR
jgi:hypothetical protein